MSLPSEVFFHPQRSSTLVRVGYCCVAQNIRLGSFAMIFHPGIEPSMPAYLEVGYIYHSPIISTYYYKV